MRARESPQVKLATPLILAISSARSFGLGLITPKVWGGIEDDRLMSDSGSMDGISDDATGGKANVSDSWG